MQRLRRRLSVPLQAYRGSRAAASVDPLLRPQRNSSTLDCMPERGQVLERGQVFFLLSAPPLAIAAFVFFHCVCMLGSAYASGSTTLMMSFFLNFERVSDLSLKPDSDFFRVSGFPAEVSDWSVWLPVSLFTSRLQMRHGTVSLRFRVLLGSRIPIL